MATVTRPLPAAAHDERREGPLPVPVNNLNWWAFLFFWQAKNRKLLEIASFSLGILIL
jgi:hypothetical protein